MRASVQLRIAAIWAAVWLGGANVARTQQTFDYTNAGGDGLWNNGSNWSGGMAGAFPNGLDDTASFSGQVASVVLDIPVTSRIEADDDSNVTISGTGSLTLPPMNDPGGLGDPLFRVDNSILEIDVPANFSGDVAIDLSSMEPFGSSSLKFGQPVEANGHNLIVVARTGIGLVLFEANYNGGNTSHVKVDGVVDVGPLQTFTADKVWIADGSMFFNEPNSGLTANKLTLHSGIVTRSGPNSPFQNLTGPIESQSGYIGNFATDGTLTIPGVHVLKGLTRIENLFAPTGATLDLGDMTRQPGGTAQFANSANSTIQAAAVADTGPGGVIPWATADEIDFAQHDLGSGEVAAVVVYIPLASSTSNDAAIVSGVQTFMGNAAASVLKMGVAGLLFGASSNSTLSTDAVLATDVNAIVANTLVPTDRPGSNSNELYFHAPTGGDFLTLNVDVKDNADPTMAIFAGSGNFTVNTAWSKTGDTCMVGAGVLRLNSNANLGGNKLKLLPDPFGAATVQLDGNVLDQHVYVHTNVLLTTFKATGNSAMTGNMTIEVNSAHNRGIGWEVPGSGDSLTYSGTITRGGIGNPLAGQGLAGVHTMGEGMIHFGPTADLTDPAVVLFLSGANGQQVVVDGSLGTTVVEGNANVRISGVGMIGNLADAVDVVAAQFGLAPGGSIGTLTVQNEMLVRTATFTYEAEITDTGQSDRLAVGGTLDLSTPNDTLDISFFAGSTLADANYTLATYGALVGIFDAVRFAGNPIAVPTAPGAFGGTHQLIYGASALLLATGPVAGVPGDYNQNGIVDAADFTVWRDLLGQVGIGLAADGSGVTPGVPDGVVDGLDYQFWVDNFGNVAGSGSAAHSAPGESPGANYAVPEPANVILAAIALFGGILFANRFGRP